MINIRRYLTILIIPILFTLLAIIFGSADSQIPIIIGTLTLISLIIISLIVALGISLYGLFYAKFLLTYLKTRKPHRFKKLIRFNLTDDPLKGWNYVYSNLDNDDMIIAEYKKRLRSVGKYFRISIELFFSAFVGILILAWYFGRIVI